MPMARRVRRMVMVGAAAGGLALFGAGAGGIAAVDSRLRSATERPAPHPQPVVGRDCTHRRPDVRF
jgi:hypothetical protein